MKKWMIGGIVSSLLIMGGIGAVWAAETGSTNGNTPSFEQMLPFMEKMHPGVDKETFQKMYNECHSNGGAQGMMGGQGASNMMGNMGHSDMMGHNMNEMMKDL
ncbi:MAG TPA: FAD/FMN-containing dehydrogenase [Bacillota bacterium]|nr:FAD/FMN-containing dehydrogenase [Bacillota bacterium]